jgi:NitT/TauT family transport system substrate-binding protein
MRKLFLVICSIVLWGMLCIGNLDASGNTVKIGYSNLRISLPVFVAQDKGMFKKNGLDVELVMFDTAQPLIDALCSGKLEVAGYSAFPITFSAQIRSKKELYYTTVLMEDDAHPLSMFVVKKDSPIKAINELKGKNIGILPTFAYKIWLELILQKNGIKPDEVTIQQVAPAMTPSALESGTVDAVFTNDPAVTICVQKEIGRLLFTYAIVPRYMWSPFPFASFNMTKEFADKNPDIAKRIVKSLDEAIDYINANQEAAKIIMGNFMPDSQKPFVKKYPDALFLKSSQFTLQELTKTGESYERQGIIKGRIDFSKALYK